MPREQLQLLASDVDRLLAAGAAVAAGDEKLRQRSGRLRELGQKVPVLAQIADAVDRTVSAPPKQVARALLDLLLVVRQVRASLTAAGGDGAAEPVPSSGPWTAAAATRDLEGWLDMLVSSGYDRPKKLKKALQQPGFTDVRMVTPLLRALGTSHYGLARLVAEKALTAFGKAVLPELERGLDLKGKSGDARRIQAICVLDPERGAALCRQALAEGSTPVKIQGLKSLSRLAPQETEKAALSLLKEKAAMSVHVAAYYALATGKSDQALEALASAFVGDRGDNWQYVHTLEHSLAKLAHPKTTARLLEELARAQEEIRTREPAARARKKAPAKKGKAKGKTALEKEAQKAARLLQEAIDRSTRLASLLGHRRDRKALPALVELLGHPNANLQGTAAEALLALDDPAGLRAVADQMDDKHLWHYAIRAAWGLPGKERFERLEPALATLSKSKASERARGQNVLNLFSWELHQLGDPDDELEGENEEDEEHDEYDDEFDDEDVYDAGDHDDEGNPRKPTTDWDPRWVPALRKHLKGDNCDSVAVALTVLQGEKMVPELLKLLPVTAVRGEEGVMNALARLKVREALPKLADLVGQKRVNVYALRQAMWRLGDPSIVPALEAHLKKTKDGYKKHLLEQLIEELERRKSPEAK
jgi:hypothetical protein